MIWGPHSRRKKLRCSYINGSKFMWAENYFKSSENKLNLYKIYNFFVLLRCSRAAQINLEGHRRNAGPVIEQDVNFEWDYFENGYFENGQPVFKNNLALLDLKLPNLTKEIRNTFHLKFLSCILSFPSKNNKNKYLPLFNYIF